MKKLTSTVFFIWSVFFVFHKEAMCKDESKPANQEIKIKDQPGIKNFSTHEILGMGIFEAPEERLFDLLSGETFHLPEESLNEPEYSSNQSRDESL